MPRKNARPQARQRLATIRRKIALSKEHSIPLRRRNGSIMQGAGAGMILTAGGLAMAASRVFGRRA